MTLVSFVFFFFFLLSFVPLEWHGCPVQISSHTLPLYDFLQSPSDVSFGGSWARKGNNPHLQHCWDEAAHDQLFVNEQPIVETKTY